MELGRQLQSHSMVMALLWGAELHEFSSFSAWHVEKIRKDINISTLSSSADGWISLIFMKIYCLLLLPPLRKLSKLMKLLDIISYRRSCLPSCANKIGRRREHELWESNLEEPIWFLGGFLPCVFKLSKWVMQTPFVLICPELNTDNNKCYI